MKSDLTLNFAAALTLALMVAVSTVCFWSFSQTSMGQFIINIINFLVLTYVPYIATLIQIIVPLWFVLSTIIAFLIYFIKSNKIKWIQSLVFLPLVPAILSFSSSSWLWLILSMFGLPVSILPQESTFLETAIYAIIIFSCVIVLKFILSTKTTRKELLSRGGNPLEVKKVIVGSFSYLLIILVASVFLSIAAALVLIVAQPLGTALIQVTPYATLVLGVGFLTLLCVLVYYYLVQSR